MQNTFAEEDFIEMTKRISQLEADLLLGNPIEEYPLEESDLYLAFNNVKCDNALEVFTNYLELRKEEGGESLDCNNFCLKDAADQNLLVAVIGLWKYFLLRNCVGPCLENDKSKPKRLETSELKRLEFDGECFDHMVEEACLIITVRSLLEQFDSGLLPSVRWWRIRVDFLNQRLLSFKSPLLWSKIQHFCATVAEYKLAFEDFNDIEVMLYSEIAQMYAFHYHVDDAKSAANKAMQISKINLQFSGVMGKRTKFQQEDKPQLIAEIIDKDNQFSSSNDDLSTENIPKNVELQDEVRLEEIKVAEGSNACLHSPSKIQKLALISYYIAQKRSSSEYEDTGIEERAATIQSLLKSKKLWAVQVMLLMERSLLEMTATRTAERAMKQMEVILKCISSETPEFCIRYEYLNSIMFPFKWKIKQVLADVLFALSCHESALMLYEELSLWEKIIECYHALDRKHKAIEVLKEEIRKSGESVKLLVCLGDASDDPEHYRKAWEISEERSALVKCRWGAFYFKRKEYAEAIPHLEKAVELNPLENVAWLRLGFCAVQCQLWKLAIKAYTHSCNLDHDNYQAWNNKGKAYVHLGEYSQALRTLKEASRCHYDMWKVWDNILTVATLQGSIQDSILAINRLMDLRPTCPIEEPMLEGILKVEERVLSLHKSQLVAMFGRLITKQRSPLIWKLYSDVLVIEDREPLRREEALQNMRNSAFYMEKSMISYLRNTFWLRELVTISGVCDCMVSLLSKVENFMKHVEEDIRNNSDALNLFQSVEDIFSRLVKLLEKEMKDSCRPEAFQRELNKLYEVKKEYNMSLIE